MQNQSLAVAKEIYRQLGGNRFVAMTGSKNFVYGKQSLTFKLTRNKAKAQSCRIELDDSDTYTVVLYSMNRELDVVTKNLAHGIYCGDLAEHFKNVTGLDTSL